MNALCKCICRILQQSDLQPPLGQRVRCGGQRLRGVHILWHEPHLRQRQLSGGGRPGLLRAGVRARVRFASVRAGVRARVRFEVVRAGGGSPSTSPSQRCGWRQARASEQLLQLWARTNKTIAFVTHSIPEAVYLSTRIVVMSPRPGRITDIIESPLPRERPLDIRDSREFIEIAQRVREGLRAGHLEV